MFDTEEQQRFESFKLGWGSSDMAPPTTKRNSHHRRRSSVSTRHESAEMMGVSLPESQPEDLSDKDNIRRRALWALEGRPEKVEIPELSSTEIEKKPMSDFPSRPSFPPGSGISGFSMQPKRDSFKVSASMDQLGTLHEEEEEEEYDSPKPVQPMTPTTPVHSTTPLNRSRPAQLNLRPLSLTPESLTTGLPTPSLTPSPQGLKSLSLLNDNDSRSHRKPVLNLQIVSEAHSPCPSPASDDSKKGSRRSSISYKPSNAGLPTPEMTPTFSERRYSSASSSSRSSMSSASDYEHPAHQSRESRSGTGALTASEQHFLFKSHNALLARITDLEKALTLRRRESLFDTSPLSRPVSMTGSDMYSEPSDEMLRLVADLKAERDELKRDVDGWRTRVGDLEKQIGLFAKRVENERREAWVARSRLGLVEGEKNGLAKDLEESRKRVDGLVKAVDSLEKEKAEVIAQKEALSHINDRLVQQNADLEREVERLTESSDLATPIAPQHGFEPHRRLFHSVDSLDSATDVDYDASPYPGFALKAVEEESENDEPLSEEDNGLAGYEDEEDYDEELQSRGSSSSFGSLSEYPRSVNRLRQPMDVPSSPRTPVAHAFEPKPLTHRKTHSLSKTWTFPRGSQASDAMLPQSESVDKFFGCLDDASSESNSSAPEFMEEYETSKGLWTSAFKNASVDDFNPFVLPNHVVGTIVFDDMPPTPSSSNSGLLAVVVEEDEEDEDSESDEVTTEDDDVFGGEIGGIKITFTPPQAEDDQSLQDGLIDDLHSSSEVETCSPEEKTSIYVDEPVINVVTPPRNGPRASGIPRPATFVKPPELPKLSSPKFGSPYSSPNTAFSTPPSKRPSFIPQPITPPSPVRNSTVKAGPKATFMRQPPRKPLNNNNSNISNYPTSGSHLLNDLTSDTDMNSSCRSNAVSSTPHAPQMKRIDDDFTRHENVMQSSPYPTNSPSSPSSISSSSFANLIPIPSPIASATRLSFQTFTNLIPFSWSHSEPDDTLRNHSEESRLQRKGFVSKEAQLEKLKNRLLREQACSRNGVEVCRKCEEAAVCL